MRRDHSALWRRSAETKHKNQHISECRDRQRTLINGFNNGPPFERAGVRGEAYYQSICSFRNYCPRRFGQFWRYKIRIRSRQILNEIRKNLCHDSVDFKWKRNTLMGNVFIFYSPRRVSRNEILFFPIKRNYTEQHNLCDSLFEKRLV